MQLNTGAPLSLMSETTFSKHWGPKGNLHLLSSYSGESIPVLDSVDVKVTYVRTSVNHLYVPPSIVTSP